METRSAAHRGKNQLCLSRGLASYYAQLGDKDHTLALFEEGLQQHSTDILWIQDDPAYDFLHADSRYQAVVRSVARIFSV